MIDVPEQRDPRRAGAAAQDASSSRSVGSPGASRDKPADPGNPSGGGEPSGNAPAGHAERSLPSDRSVLWVPRKLRLTGQEVSTPYEIFVSQSVLRDIGQHVSAAAEEVAGLLGGRLFRCPETDRPWVRIDAAMPAPEGVPENAEAETLASALAPLRQRLERSGARSVGWYHSHTFLGVFLSDRDARFHLQHFPELWQCALVLVGDRDRPAGGLFQPTTPGRIARSVYLPLHELTGSDARTPDGRKRAILNWGNYVPDEPVARDSTPPHGAGASAPTGPGTSRSGSWFGRSPGGGRRPERTDPQSHEHPIEVPLVLPAEERSGAGEFLRRVGGRLGRLLLLALVLVGGWFLWDRVIDRSATEGSAAVRGGERSAEAAGAGEGPVSAFLDARRQFLRIVDSYQERRADFDLGRIACEGLAAGYQNVDEAFLRMSEVYVSLRDEPGPPPADRYEAAARRMEEVDRHFDASGCPRPE